MKPDDKSNDGAAQRAREAAAEQTPALVGKRIKQLRGFLKKEGHVWHTQVHLADLAGVHQSIISNCETGKAMLAPEVALVFCHAFSRETFLHMDWIYRGDTVGLRDEFKRWIRTKA